MAARSCGRFLHPLYSFRKAGFPHDGWRRGLATLRTSAAVPAAFDTGPVVLLRLALCPGVSNHGCTHRPLAQHGLSSPHLQSLLRPDPPVWRTPSSLGLLGLLWQVVALAGRSSHLPFFGGRLRQSLPQSGSPPTGVCYHYSAQPPIAETGLAPANMSKFEGWGENRVESP